MNEQELNAEINSHSNNPKNYGQIYPSNGVGMGFNPENHHFVIFYLYIEDEILKDVGYGVNADEESIILASMFSEMIKGEKLDSAKKTAKLMREEIKNSSTPQQNSAKIVLSSFDAAVINHKNLENKIQETMHKLPIS